VLNAERLTKRFSGTIAVDDLSLAVAPGEIFALLGPNGAGKTTTINCFLGFLAPDGGRVTVDGLDVAIHALETKRRLAYIPEQVSLYPRLPKPPAPASLGIAGFSRRRSRIMRNCARSSIRARSPRIGSLRGTRCSYSDLSMSRLTLSPCVSCLRWPRLCLLHWRSGFGVGARSDALRRSARQF
jgi:energy-coupling factor transporter ATP-binding protein EcfA2